MRWKSTRYRMIIYLLTLDVHLADTGPWTRARRIILHCDSFTRFGWIITKGMDSSYVPSSGPSPSRLADPHGIARAAGTREPRTPQKHQVIVYQEKLQKWEHHGTSMCSGSSWQLPESSKTFPYNVNLLMGHPTTSRADSVHRSSSADPEGHRKRTATGEGCNWQLGHIKITVRNWDFRKQWLRLMGMLHHLATLQLINLPRQVIEIHRNTPGPRSSLEESCVFLEHKWFIIFYNRGPAVSIKWLRAAVSQKTGFETEAPETSTASIHIPCVPKWRLCFNPVLLSIFPFRGDDQWQARHVLSWTSVVFACSNVNATALWLQIGWQTETCTV